MEINDVLIIITMDNDISVTIYANDDNFGDEIFRAEVMQLQ